MRRKASYAELERENANLRQRVKELEAELAEVKALLQKLLGQDSHNSHKPPSGDKRRYHNTKLKVKEKLSAKKAKPTTLDYSAQLDEITHLPLKASHCGCGQDLTGLQSHHERIQVYDLPKLRLEVTEYRRERKRCACGILHEAALPAGVVRGVQYGSRVKGLLSYLHHYQQLPMKRCCEVLADCFGQAVSQKSLGRFQDQLYQRLAPAEQHIKAHLQQAEVLHSDETGMFISGENHWLHVRSNDRLTFYHIDKSRGIKAHHKMGLLAEHQGYLVHDCYSSYFKHTGKHVLCHAHTLRELLALHEQDQKQVWAYHLAKHLVHVQHQRLETPLSPTEQVAYQSTYRNLLLEGLVQNPANPPPEKPRKGKRKNSHPHNLIMRLLTHADAATRFMRDASVPFSNNQAERDLRMAKLKQKISGGFRTPWGARCYARIRGYISTARKQAQPILDILTQVFEHNVWLPAS
jgi:transposase